MNEKSDQFGNLGLFVKIPSEVNNWGFIDLEMKFFVANNANAGMLWKE